jgi:hypothetical protein
MKKIASSNRSALLGIFVISGLFLLCYCSPENGNQVDKESDKLRPCLLDIAKWSPGEPSPSNRVLYTRIDVNDNAILYNNRHIPESDLYDRLCEL